MVLVSDFFILWSNRRAQVRTSTGVCTGYDKVYHIVCASITISNHEHEHVQP